MRSAEPLVQWIKSLGGNVHPKVDLMHTLSSGDKGVVALDDIEEGEQLVLVPMSCVLYMQPGSGTVKSAPSDAAKYLASCTGLSSFVSTVLLLMYEMSKGAASPYLQYIQSLPDSCDCLLHWSEEDKAELKGAKCMSKARSNHWAVVTGTSIDDSGAQAQGTFEQQAVPAMAGRPDLWPAPHNALEEFLRVAGLVQSRAFHMEAENWVTGTMQEGAELYLIPGIDMINHATDVQRRNTSLHKFNTTLKVDVGGQEVNVEGFFEMKASRTISKGEQALHTYGDLSDAQLLQIYGFVDVPEPGVTGNSNSSSSSSGAHAGGLPKLENPHNHALVPWSVVHECMRATLQQSDPDEELSEQLESEKIRFLTAQRLLQPAAPERTEFVVTRANPLNDVLLTVVQVMLMMEEEFQELQQQQQQQHNGQYQDDIMPLSLGTTLLEEDGDFAESVCFTLVQIVDACMQRYPTTIKEDAKLLKAGAAGKLSRRLWLALLIRMGEKDVLQLCKKQAVLLLMGLKDAAGESEDEEEEEEEVLGAGRADGPPSKRQRTAAKGKQGLGRPASAKKRSGADDDEEDEEEEQDGGLLDSDDSDKVGYGAEEFDDGIGEAHDRGKAHELPDD